MNLLRTSLATAILGTVVLSGCGILDKLRGQKDAGNDTTAAPDTSDAAVATQTDEAGTDAGQVSASGPIIGACKPNDVADCTNKCQVQHNQSSCVNLGIMFANGAGVPKDLGKAATLFQGACNAGIAAGCDHFGLALQFGQGIQQDLPRAIDTLTKGCNLGNAESCNRRALMAERAQGGPKDPVTAVTFYQKACNLGDAFGCGNLANHLASGEGIPKDPARAAQLRKQACDKGDQPACNALAASGGDAGVLSAAQIDAGAACDCACQKKNFLLECNKTRKLQDVACEKQVSTTPVLAKCRGH
ncbi:MAG TPA: tetratricopeptide repeat protein [Labilithrix sp.]